MRLNSLVISTVFVFSACGQMNKEKPPVTGGGENTQATPQPIKGVNATKNNLFLVYVALQKSETKPVVGDNIYNIRVQNVSDLGPISERGKLTVSYWMPEMPGMGKFDALTTRNQDGTYAVTLFFSMAGKWEVTITIQDEIKKDDYVFGTIL